MANRMVKGRTIVVETTKVINDNGSVFEVVANIRCSRFNPRILTCRIGEEYYMISKPAMQALVFSKKSNASPVSIYKTLNREVHDGDGQSIEQTKALLNKMTNTKEKGKRR